MNPVKFLLDPLSLESLVTPVTYQRGLTVYRNQQVMDFELLCASSKEWTIEGEVQGSEREPYWASVLIEVNADGKLTYFDGDCSCAVGSNCKHTVAITLKAAYKSGQVIGAGVAGSRFPTHQAPNDPEPEVSISPVDRHRQQAHGRVVQWLDLFNAADAKNPRQFPYFHLPS